MFQSATYRIQIAGPPDPGFASWFEGLTVYAAPGAESTLTTPPIDQATLHGILSALRDLAIPLIAVSRIEIVT